jgi:uncharacterized membrane protein YfcA
MTEREAARRTEPRAADSAAGTLTLTIALACVACIAVALFADPGGPTHWRMAIPALFVAAAVSGVAGFAFSALALALAGWCFPDPVAMVGTFLVCSIAIQVYSVARLYADIDAKALAPFVLGGLAGTPLGTWMLLHLQVARLGALLGAMLLAWCVFMLLRRPGWTLRGTVAGDLLAGALGGITGGVAAFPGAVLVPLLGLRGWSKARQRATFQPFILLMQLASLASLEAQGGFQTLEHGTLPPLPVLAAAVASLAGAHIGLRQFGRLDDRQFTRWVLALLAASGVAMIVRGWPG